MSVDLSAPRPVTGHDGAAERLCQAALFFAHRGYCPATGGNFSTRLDDGTILITASGVDKRALSPADLLILDASGHIQAGRGRPSAETGLHRALYALDPTIGTILHVHSQANTLLSRINQPTELTLSGYEMQKSIAHQHNHLDTLTVPVLDNSQDMDTLAAAARDRFGEATAAHAFLVRGHGIYVWGRDTPEAQRHLEGWEFLLACELQRRTLEKGQ